MNQFFKGLLLFASVSLIFSSCATIVGGSSYNAIVKVEGHPSAKISYRNSIIGTGTASIPIPRQDANKVKFTVSKENCPTKDFVFNTRQFRGWAFFGSLMLMPIVNGIPIPITHLIDFATGSYFKPNLSNPAIYKQDYNNYNYLLAYTCTSNEETGGNEEKGGVNSTKEVSKEDKLIELKELFDSGMITEEEYKKSRLKILGE